MKTGGIAKDKRTPKGAHNSYFPRVVLQIFADRDLKSRSGRYDGCQSGSYGLLTQEGSP